MPLLVKNSALNLDFIKELSYVTGSYPEMDLLLSQREKGGIEHWMALNYSYVVYLDLPDSKEIIRTCQSSTRFIRPEKKFADYLLNLPDINLNDLIYLCTLYGRRGVENKLFEFYNGSIDFLKDYLKETYGRLIYKQQAIYLFMFYKKCSNEEAIYWIRGLNDGERTAIRMAINTKGEDYNFYTLWDEYTFNKRVYEPKYKPSQKLFKLMN